MVTTPAACPAPGRLTQDVVDELRQASLKDRTCCLPDAGNPLRCTASSGALVGTVHLAAIAQKDCAWRGRARKGTLPPTAGLVGAGWR